MASALIKFYNAEYLLSDSPEKLSQAVKEDFQPFTIKSEINRLIILEDQNTRLCTLLYNTCFTVQDDQLIRVYAKSSETVENKAEFLIMELKVAKNEHLKWLQEQFRLHERFQKVRGPLSYEPIRQDRVSLLSTESPEQNFRGFINLGILILILNHVRLIVENFLKYGNQIKDFPFFATFPKYKESPIFLSLLLISISTLIAFIVQKLSFKQKLSPKTVGWINFVNCLVMVIVPVILIQKSHPTLNLLLLGILLVSLLKIISYIHTMRNIRFYIERIKEVDGKKVPITEFFKESEITDKNLSLIRHAVNKPESLVSFGQYLYFLAAPTYCFQLSYPRSPKIRKIWLIKRLIELVFIYLIWIIVWYQYVEPILNTTYQQFVQDNYQMSFLVFIERVMRLAVPNTYLWVLFFYMEFQLRCNIVAEILRFGDRQFYLDWWNCKNLGEYWRLWNLPVHHWLTRHLYFPLLKRGQPRWKANIVVFLVSAIAHEFLVSASLGIVEFWAFFGMLVQAPVIIIQDKLEKSLKLQSSQLGNAMFWISFCFFGQPLCIFVYYFHFLQQQQALA